MKTLKVDDKWSILYDDNFNDSPKVILRYGVDSDYNMDNLHVAMFYKLLEIEGIYNG